MSDTRDAPRDPLDVLKATMPLRDAMLDKCNTSPQSNVFAHEMFYRLPEAIAAWEKERREAKACVDAGYSPVAFVDQQRALLALKAECERVEGEMRASGDDLGLPWPTVLALADRLRLARGG